MWHPQPAHTWWFWLPACPSYLEYPKSGEKLIRASQRLPRSVLNLRSIPLPFGSSNSKESVSGLEIKPISHALGDVTFQKGFALLDNTQHLYRRFFLVSQDLSEVCGMFSLLLRQNTMGSAGSMLCLSQHWTRHLLRAAPAQWTLQNSTGSFISSLTGIFIWAELTVVSRQALRKTSPLSLTCSVWASPAGSERKERGGSSSWGSAFPWGPGDPLSPCSVCVPSPCYQPFHAASLAAELMPSLENQRICGNELQPHEELCTGSSILVLLTFSSSNTPGWPLNTAISVPFRDRECYSSQIHSKASFLWMVSSPVSV